MGKLHLVATCPNPLRFCFVSPKFLKIADWAIRPATSAYWANPDAYKNLLIGYRFFVHANELQWNFAGTGPIFPIDWNSLVANIEINRKKNWWDLKLFLLEADFPCCRVPWSEGPLYIKFGNYHCSIVHLYHKDVSTFLPFCVRRALAFPLFRVRCHSLSISTWTLSVGKTRMYGSWRRQHVT